MIFQKSRKNGSFYFVMGFLIMALLFISSSQTYEQQSQIGLLSKLLKNEPLKENLNGISFLYAGQEVSIQAKGYFAFVEFFIRKFAHFATYFLLGGSFFLGLLKKMNATLLTALFAWLASTGYAAIDEFHQMLTGGRTPLFQDVMLDSCGAFVAVVLCWLVIGIKKKRIF